MAEEKKKPGYFDTVHREVYFFLAALFVLALIVVQVSVYLRHTRWNNFQTLWNYFLHSYFFPLWNNWKVLAVLLSIGAIGWAVYSYFKLQEIIAEEKMIYGPTPKQEAIEDAQVEKQKNKKWERVVEHANSTNPADWRLAIMEADIILEETLRSKGFPGDSIGEMLKSAKPGDFLTLDAAWDAHKVRNRIAHSGGDFELNERETHRVIGLFESVFREFGEI